MIGSCGDGRWGEAEVVVEGGLWAEAKCDDDESAVSADVWYAREVLEALVVGVVQFVEVFEAAGRCADAAPGKAVVGGGYCSFGVEVFG